MKRITLLCFFILLIEVVYAQNPKREMRSAWLATVWGIDWPSSVISTTGSKYEIAFQKQCLVEILDSLKSANLNTVFFQVRSRCDVMFKSKYEPWSSDLVAKRGMDPGYDPLRFAIEECHKRGMELHAWMNPYRFESATDQWKDQAGDYRKTNPDWLMFYTDKKGNVSSILNPGIPAVAERIRDLVMEVVDNYDVDGIAFDDYFYSYDGTSPTHDQAAQDLYKPAGKDINDWRRENVNSMIALVYNSIQQKKPWVTFGVSPFGIWTTDQKVAEKEGISLPSGITGANMYSQIYCDPVAWLKEGTVDYISPQLYWPTDKPGQDYNILAPWWSDLAAKFGRHFYSSHTLASLENIALTKSSVRVKDIEISLNSGISMREKAALMEKTMRAEPRLLPAEYILQIKKNRTSDKNNAPGSVFYSSNKFFIKGFIPSLINSVYSTEALPPAMHWKSPVQYPPVEDISLADNTISWTPVDGIVRYAVYAVKKSELTEPKKYFTAQNLLSIVYGSSYDVPLKIDMSIHTFGVVALDRFGNESSSVILGAPQMNNTPVKLLYPLNNDGMTHGSSFEWENNIQASSYFLEVATTPSFDNLIYSFETNQNSMKSENMTLLKNGQTYYWRIRSRVPGTIDSYSEVRSISFVSLEICYPLNNSKDVSVTPEVRWNSIGTGYKYNLQISKNISFSSIVEEELDITGLSFIVPKERLEAEATYYLRIKGYSASYQTEWSPIISFTTLVLTPDVPVILTPKHMQQLSGSDLLVEWTEDTKAKSFRVELCDAPDFPARKVKAKTINPFTYNVTYTGLVPGTYFIRACANFSLTTNKWSKVVQIDMLTTSLDKTKSNGCRAFAIKDKRLVVIQLDSDLCEGEFYLYSITGQEVFRKIVNQEAGILNEIVLPQSVGKGAFIVVLKSREGRNSFKIIL